MAVEDVCKMKLEKDNHTDKGIIMALKVTYIFVLTSLCFSFFSIFHQVTIILPFKDFISTTGRQIVIMTVITRGMW